MVNSQVVKEISNALKIDERIEKIPAALPVIEVGIKSVKPLLNAQASANNTGAAVTILAAQDKDVYISAATLSYIKDATSTSTSTQIKYYDENNKLKNLIFIPTLTLTAGYQTVHVTFNHPIKIYKNTAITLEHSAGVANISGTATVFYYVDEVN